MLTKKKKLIPRELSQEAKRSLCWTFATCLGVVYGKPLTEIRRSLLKSQSRKTSRRQDVKLGK